MLGSDFWSSTAMRRLLFVIFLLLLPSAFGLPLNLGETFFPQKQRVDHYREAIADSSSDEEAVPWFLEREMDKVIKEIELRLAHEENLFLFQFLVVGTVAACVIGTSGLGHVLGRSPIRRSGEQTDAGPYFLEQPEVSRVLLLLLLCLVFLGLLLIDMHLKYNSVFFYNLGHWLRVAVENNDPRGWESYLVNYGILKSWTFPFANTSLHLPTMIVGAAFYALLFLAPVERAGILRNVLVFLFWADQVCLTYIAFLSNVAGRDLYRFGEPAAAGWADWAKWVPPVLVVVLSLCGYLASIVTIKGDTQSTSSV